MRFLSILSLLAILFTPLMACDQPEAQNDQSSETADDQSSEAAVDESSEAEEQPADNPALLDPSLATEEAPEQFQVLFETTAGEFTMEINRAWAPNGADRLYNLVRIGFFDDIAFFRVIEGFMVQFGIHGDPEVARAWRDADIPDDPVVKSNQRGKVTFATRGPNTRTTQIFINFGDNSNLDQQGFTPIGQIVDGMDVVDSIYSGYGEGAPRGRGPDQGRMQRQGNDYLRSDFEQLDYTTSVTIVE